MNKCGGCGDRELETVFWPSIHEEREEVWINILNALMPQVKDLQIAFHNWSTLSWSQQESIERRIQKSAEAESDHTTNRHHILTLYMINSFAKWNAIQDQLGAPGCDVDVSCLSGRCERDLIRMLQILQDSTDYVLRQMAHVRSKKNRKNKCVNNGISIQKTNETEEDSNHYINHDLDYSGGDIMNEVDTDDLFRASSAPPLEFDVDDYINKGRGYLELEEEHEGGTTDSTDEGLLDLSKDNGNSNLASNKSDTYSTCSTSEDEITLGYDNFGTPLPVTKL